MTSVKNICILPTDMTRTRSKRQPDPLDNILEKTEEGENVREKVSSVEHALFFK